MKLCKRKKKSFLWEEKRAQCIKMFVINKSFSILLHVIERELEWDKQKKKKILCVT